MRDLGLSIFKDQPLRENMKLKIILRQLIKAREMTVVGLAKKSKVPIQTIHNWLSGAEPKSLKQVKMVADCLGVSVDYLCFGIGHNGSDEKKESNPIKEHSEEINAGIFEVVLRKVKR